SSLFRVIYKHTHIVSCRDLRRRRLFGLFLSHNGLRTFLRLRFLGLPSSNAMRPRFFPAERIRRSLCGLGGGSLGDLPDVFEITGYRFAIVWGVGRRGSIAWGLKRYGRVSSCPAHRCGLPSIWDTGASIEEAALLAAPARFDSFSE